MKYLSLVTLVLMAISLLTVVLYFVGAAEVDLMLRWMYIMLGLAVASVVIMSIYSLAQNPKNTVRSLVGLGIVVVAIGVAWALSSDAMVVTPSNVYDDSFSLKLADTGLYLTYAALIATVLAIAAGEIYSATK